MKLFGLIGYPLSHSFSKKFFTDKFQLEGIDDCQYELFPIEKIEELNTLLAKHHDLIGLNVTIPYKELVIPFLDELTPAVQSIGACNCISVVNGKLKGYNTDVIGFQKTLEPKLKLHHKKALVLGTGGAAKAVHHVLKSQGIEFIEVSRTARGKIISYDQIGEDLLSSHTLIINTTPLGMYPDVDAAPELPYDAIGPEHYLYDLVYNPDPTLFLKKGMQRGATTENGSEMLRIQAEESWKIWNT
jgi:shikimate dehydrogenase